MIFVIYDGDCGICTSSAKLIDKLNKNSKLSTIPSYLFDFDKYCLPVSFANDTVIYFDSDTSELFYKFRAIGEIFKHLGFIPKVLSYILRNPFIPFLINPIYDFIASNRARISSWFGLNACKIRE